MPSKSKQDSFYIISKVQNWDFLYEYSVSRFGKGLFEYSEVCNLEIFTHICIPEDYKWFRECAVELTITDKFGDLSLYNEQKRREEPKSIGFLEINKTLERTQATAFIPHRSIQTLIPVLQNGDLALLNLTMGPIKYNKGIVTSIEFSTSLEELGEA